MNRREIEAVERDEVTREVLEDALKQVLVSPAESRPRSENREPTREELNRRYRLERRGWRKEVTMDAYTKGVLTVIAIALCAIVVQNAIPDATATLLSQDGCGEYRHQPCYLDVRIR